MSAADEAVWQRVQASMPVHGCGCQMQAGGTEATGPVLVCVGCSYVEGVAWEWVDAKVAEARAALEAQGGAL